MLNQLFDVVDKFNKQKKDPENVKFGIKKKLLAAVLTVSVMVIIVILFLVYRNTSQIVLQKSNTILQTSTDSVVNKVEAWMNKTITALNVERDALSYFSLNRKQEIDYIKHTANTYDAFPSGIYVATVQGELLHASFVPGPTFNVFEKTWYKDGIKSEEFIFGSVYFDEDSKSYVVGASGVLKDNKGVVRGVAAADIYLNAISEIVSEVKLEQTGGMFLIDANTNTIIGHQDANLVGKELAQQDVAMYKYIADLVKNHKDGLLNFEQADGDVICLDIQSVPNSDWIAVAYVPYNEVMADLNSLTKTIAITAFFGIFLLILFIERTIHLIIKPLNGLNAAIHQITEYDFSTNVEASSRDEIGLMADRLSIFIKNMRELMKKIMGVSGDLSNRSVGSAKVAEELSKTAETQDKSMKEITITVGELVKSIDEVAENATSLSLLVADAETKGDEANAQMRDTVLEATQGRKGMEQVVEAMQSISTRMTNLEISIQEVENSLVKINGIVDLIRGIAAETNLLSLNASIEAARAGESGRGFAVVASQIGKLASTSTDAVEDIAKLTAAIRQMVENTVSETKENVVVIKDSTGLVNETGVSFDTIFSAINKTDMAVTEMIEKVHQVNDIAMGLAGITEEQSAASSEILVVFERLEDSSKNVLDSSRTVAGEAVQLKDTAKDLSDKMKMFTI